MHGSRVERESARPVRRAIRHPAAGLGWLWLQDAEAQALTLGGPPQQHPDPRISGQNPEFTAYAWAMTRDFASRPGYREQIESRIRELVKERDSLIASLDGLRAQVDALQADIDQTASLISHD